MAQADSKWPRWPDGTKGKQLVRVRVAWDVDTLFQAMFGTASPFAVKSQEARGNKEMRETPWLPTEAALASVEMQPVAELLGGAGATGGAAGANGNGSSRGKGKAGSKAPVGILPQGSVRRIGFSAAGMGMKYKTEELQRLLLAQQGKFYTLEGCVSTTATYGDTFRVITRTRLTAGEATGSCELTIESTLVYLSAVNKFVRGCIERGADSGLSKNFAQYVELLGKEVGVTDLTKLPAETANVEVAAGPSEQAAAVVPAGRLWGGLLDAELALQMEPIAAWMLSKLPGGADTKPAASPAAKASRLAQMLAAALLLLCIHLATRQLRRLSASCTTLPGWAADVCRRTVAMAQLPAAMHTVLAGFVLVVLLQAGLASGLSLLPPIATAVREHWVARQAAATAASIQRTLSEDAPAVGVRFEGFDAAFTNDVAVAQPDPPSAAGTAMQQTVKAMGAVRDMWHESFAAILSPRSQSPQADAGVANEADASLPQKLPRADTGTLVAARFASAPSLTRATSDSSAAERELTADERAAVATATAREDSPAAQEAEEGDPGPRLEEVFENERAQPFRGWGHTWPGHFLPTDRVGHWSTRAGGPGGQPSMSFRSVAPRLRPGYEWEEAKWHVDLSGLGAAAVDSEGWAYAVDFPWLLTPPPPGAGRKQVTHFVRRRRWVRTQRPAPGAADMHPGSSAAGASAGGGSPPREGQLLEALSFPKPLDDSALARLTSSPMPPPSPPRRPPIPASEPAKPSSLDLLPPPEPPANPAAAAHPTTPQPAPPAQPSSPEAGAAVTPAQPPQPAQPGPSAQPAAPLPSQPGSAGDTTEHGVGQAAPVPGVLAPAQQTHGQSVSAQELTPQQAPSGNGSPAGAGSPAAEEAPSSGKQAQPQVQQVTADSQLGSPRLQEQPAQVSSPARAFGAAFRKTMPSWLGGSNGGSPVGSTPTSAATSPKAPSIPTPKLVSPPRLAPEQAAAAARLLMSGNRLPGISEAAMQQGVERTDSGHLSSAGNTPSPGSPVGPPGKGVAGPEGKFGSDSQQLGHGILAELDTLEREPAVQVAVNEPDDARRRSGEAPWQRQRHRLAEHSSSLDGAVAGTGLQREGVTDTKAALQEATIAHGYPAPPQTAAASPAESAAAAAAASAATAAAHEPQLPELPTPASLPPRSPTAEDAEVPSFMEDALGRRAEADTAAALGSTDMSGSDLALLNRELGEACSQEGGPDTHQASLDRLALITEAPVAKAADASNGITAEGGADRNAAHEQGHATAESGKADGGDGNAKAAGTGAAAGPIAAAANNEDRCLAA